MKPKQTVIPIDLYNVDISLLLGGSRDELQNIVNKWSGHEKNIVPSNAKGWTGRIPGYGFVVWLEKWPNNPITYSYMVHEAFHATDFILEDINTPLTHETEEVYAYLIGYIVHEILKRKPK